MLGPRKMICANFSSGGRQIRGRVAYDVNKEKLGEHRFHVQVGNQYQGDQNGMLRLWRNDGGSAWKRSKFP